MKSLQDAIYNWLTIRVVLDCRPNDLAAAETEKMFLDILKNDHSLENISVTNDLMMYYVNYEQNGEQKMHRFPRDMVEVMLKQINNAPERYENYPEA